MFVLNSTDFCMTQSRIAQLERLLPWLVDCISEEVCSWLLHVVLMAII